MPTQVVANTHVLAALLAVVAVPNGTAQVLPPLDEFSIRVFDVESGLLAGDVRGLVQTTNGYLYVGGGRGIVRFDGHRFHRVELPGAHSTFIDRLYVDRQNRVWILFRGGGLGYVGESGFRALPSPELTGSYFSETSDGTIWTGTRGTLLRVTTRGDLRITRFTVADGLPDAGIVGVFDLAQEERVVVTTRRVARVEGDPSASAEVRFVPLGPEHCVIRDARAEADALWLACTDVDGRQSLLRYRDGRFSTYAPPTDGARLDLFSWTDKAGGHPEPGPGWYIHHTFHDRGRGEAGQLGVTLALVDRAGGRWLSIHNLRTGRDHLVRWNAGRIDTIGLRRHLDFRSIHHLLEDHEGSLWIGTDRGLLQLSPSKVVALTRRHGLAEGFTVPVLQTTDGALWVGTWGGGLHRYAGGTLTRRYTTADGLRSNKIRALWEAPDRALWIGTQGGFAAIRGGRLLRSEPASEVRAFAETPDGTLWMGTAHHLLVRTPEGVERAPHALPFPLEAWSLHAARDGALWVAGESGLFRLEGRRVRAFDAGDGLRGSAVMAIHEQADGTLWFSTYEHGLHRYRGGRFAAVTTQEGLPQDGIWRMLWDGHGGVWMSSDGGVFRVEHSRLHAVADAVERGERPTTPLAPIVFTEAEGMPNREGNRAFPGGWRLDDGRLVFNNLEGVVVIDPVRAIEAPPAPTAVLHTFHADGEPVPLRYAGAPRLPPGTKHLAFEFAALSFMTPDQNRHRYRLDGYDDAWVGGGTARRASYTNLSPGRYTFRVQGASGSSGWGPGDEFSFSVAPFVWQTAWFRLLAAALLAGLLFAAHRYRVGRLLAMQRLRLRIAADLHDDIGSNLSSIALGSELLRERTGLGGFERHQLERIRRTAEETVESLRDIIWIVDPKHDDLVELVRKMRSSAGNLLNGIAYTFDAPEPVEPRRLGIPFVRNVLLIFKEAVHNAAKHSGASRVTIQLADEGGQLLFRIQDDGVGFDEKAVRGGHGLGNMRRRAEQADGHLRIESALQAGTRITFSAPMA